MFLFKRDGSATVYVGEEDLRLSDLWNLATGGGPVRQLPELRNLSTIEAQTRTLQMVLGLDQLGHKINAIKLVRSITGWGLVKSKNWVEDAVRLVPGTDVRCLSA